MLVNALIIISISYAALVTAVYCLQDRLIYFPFREVEQTPADIGLMYEEVRLIASDGVEISAWLIPAGNDMTTLIFCHGNAGNISHRLDSIRIFNRLGISVLIFDYRGYGKSGGKPSEQGTYRDAEAAWDYLVKVKGRLPGKIIAFGESIGCAVAAELALKKQTGGLICLAGFTSLPELGQLLYPWLPVKLLSKYTYATIDKIGSITCPKLIIHSPDDEIVPFMLGKALFEKAAEPKEFLEIKGGHNEGFIVSGALYSDGLKKFLEKYAGL